MQSNLIRYSLGTPLYFKTKYGAGIVRGTVCGLHDDFVRVKVNAIDLPFSVRFEDILSVYEND